MNGPFSENDLKTLREAAALLQKYRFSDVFGDVSGALQKVLDYIEIQSTAGDGEEIDFIYPEKQPHFRGSEFLSPIMAAIRKKQAIRLYYQPFYEEKPYFTDVHPYLLREHRSRWYLVGLNDFRDQLRTYALDRIHDLQSSDIAFRTGDLKAGEYFRHSIGVIAPEGDPPKSVIAVQKTQAQYLISQPWHESQNIEEESQEEVVFSFRVHPTYEFISLLLSLGKDARIIAPDSLRTRIRDEILEMLEKLTDRG